MQCVNTLRCRDLTEQKFHLQLTLVNFLILGRSIEIAQLTWITEDTHTRDYAQPNAPPKREQ